MTDDQFPPSIIRMIRIVEDVRQWIREHGQRLVKSDPVILEVLCSFLGIPLKFRGHQIVVSVPVSILSC